MEAQESGTGIDTTVPHSARIWNYWLGGKDNYPVDRELGDRFGDMFPEIRQMARVSRAFLRRAIGYLAADAGISQFLDIGTGLPTVDNTHEIAQRINPRARIVYVDNDPLVLTHAHALLTSTPQGVTDYVHADLREPAAIIEAAGQSLDLDTPIAVNLAGILGHVPDLEQARSIVRELLAPLPSGSHVKINDSTNEPPDPVLERATSEYNTSGTAPYTLRTWAQIASFFDGLELVEPGVVMTSQWRPEPGAEQPLVHSIGAVARKP